MASTSKVRSPRRRVVAQCRWFSRESSRSARCALPLARVVIQLRESRKLGRAQQARDRQGAAGVTESRADRVRLAPQIAAQKTGQERIPGAQHVVDLDVHPRRDQSVFESLGNVARKYDATLSAALAHDDRIRQRADMANGFERVFAAGGDVHLPSSVPTIRSQSGSTAVRAFVTVAEGA